MTVFIDTNVLLDVLLERKPHVTASADVWSLCETGQVKGCISVISFNNIYYIIRKLGGASKAARSMELLRSVFAVVELDSQMLNQAIDADYDDFEDAIQSASAVRAAAETIISRNVRHFRDAVIPAVTPEQLLAVDRTRGS